MLTIKVDKNNEGLVKKIFGSTTISYIKDLFKKENIKIIDDSKYLELITSDLLDKNEESTTIELTFKKVITINNKNIEDKQSLDKIISEIKNFCDQAVNTNNYVYLPLNMRERKNADTRTSATGDRIKWGP
jgi:hypothetical protein